MATSVAENTVNVDVASDEALFEIIDGQRVELPPMGAYAVRLANQLVFLINLFARAHNLGEAVVEVLFHLSLPKDRNRRPDGAFVSYQRWAKGKTLPEHDNAWDVVPDLAIEVVSRFDAAEELQRKIMEYFDSGVQLVWVIYPNIRRVLVYESLQVIRPLSEKDSLDGGKVLPGFTLPLNELFQPKSDA